MIRSLQASRADAAIEAAPNAGKPCDTKASRAIPHTPHRPKRTNLPCPHLRAVRK